jgi:hypothetical protein
MNDDAATKYRRGIRHRGDYTQLVISLALCYINT